MTKTSEKYYTRLANDLATDILHITFSYVEFKGGMNDYKARCKNALDQVLPEFTKIIRLAKRGLIIEAEIVPSMVSTYNTMKPNAWKINERLRNTSDAT